MEENVKIINLDNDNIDKVITIQDKEANKIEKDIYIKTLQNELLKDIPVEFQNDKLVQDEIRREVNETFELKEDTENILNADREYGSKLAKDLYEGHFSKAKWIIPVVLDQHFIYALHCKQEEDNENISNKKDKKEQIESELIFGDKLLEQSEGMIALFNLYKSYGKNEISLEKFYSKFDEIVRPYAPPPITFFNEKNMPKAKKIVSQNYEEVIRYLTFDKSNYKLRVSKGE